MKKEALNKQLDNIINDKTSGSVEILVKLNNLIKINSDEQEVIEKIINAVGTKLNEFQIINKYLSQIKKLNYDHNRIKFKTFLNNYIDSISNQYDVVYEKVKKLLKEKSSILTLSNSKTVFEVLKKYSQKNKKLKIFICESRPKNEGTNFNQTIS